LAEGAGKVDRAGDLTLANFHARYGRWLHAQLRRRFGSDATDDIAQDTWLRLARLPTIAAITHPKAFILRVAINSAISDQRRAKRGELARAAASMNTCAEAAAQHESVILREIVLGLPQPLRDVFVLSRFGGLTNSQIADQLGISPESAYRVEAVSPAGAGGLTQLMPGTATDLGVRDRFDVDQNLSGGADYLARQLIRFGDVRLALAVYNSAPDRVARLGRIPEIAETRAYVVSVVECYLALSAGRGPRSSRDCRPPEGGL
jgi:RNA polymerase sigma factor (sigma-70 family)